MEVTETEADHRGQPGKKSWPRRLLSFGESAAVTLLIILLGATYRGDWLLILVHFSKRSASKLSAEAAAADLSNSSQVATTAAGSTATATSLDDCAPEASRAYDALGHLLEDTSYLRDFGLMWAGSIAFSSTIYFGVCGFLHWHFYVRQQDKAEEWKCQPYKWLTRDAEKREIILGVSSLICVNAVTAVFATYLLSGGPSMMYYQIDEYSWTWWFLQWPVLYIVYDYITYWFHRLYHFPTLYKMFHKWHHSWKQPTAWSATAIHPVEIVHLQLLYILVLFIIPIHLFAFLSIAIYCFYHGLVDHSGINFKAKWWQPWQPDASFHDQHHEFTHVNFGFNMFIWDKIHGTERRTDRVYNENVFYGRGKLLSEATKEELEAYYEERALRGAEIKTKVQ